MNESGTIVPAGYASRVAYAKQSKIDEQALLADQPAAVLFRGPWFAPLVAETARCQADFVVLGETLAYAGTGASYPECAENIPGPSTDDFGERVKPQVKRRGPSCARFAFTCLG